MLPCNVVVQEHENGEVEVSAYNPEEMLGHVDNLKLQTFTTEIKKTLEKVLVNV